MNFALNRNKSKFYDHQLAVWSGFKCFHAYFSHNYKLRGFSLGYCFAFVSWTLIQSKSLHIYLFDFLFHTLLSFKFYWFFSLNSRIPKFMWLSGWVCMCVRMFFAAVGLVNFGWFSIFKFHNSTKLHCWTEQSFYSSLASPVADSSPLGHQFVDAFFAPFQFHVLATLLGFYSNGFNEKEKETRKIKRNH